MNKPQEKHPSLRGRASDHARQVRVYGQDKRGGIPESLCLEILNEKIQNGMVKGEACLAPTVGENHG